MLEEKHWSLRYTRSNGLPAPINRRFVDRGYRGHGIKDINVISPARSAAMPSSRSSRTNHDGWMGRNYLHVSAGNAMNAILAAAASSDSTGFLGSIFFASVTAPSATGSC